MANINILVRLPADLVAQLTAEAAEWRMSRTAYIESCLWDRVDSAGWNYVPYCVMESGELAAAEQCYNDSHDKVSQRAAFDDWVRLIRKELRRINQRHTRRAPAKEAESND